MTVVLFLFYILCIEFLIVLWLRYLRRLEQNNARLQMNISYEKQYQDMTEEALESIRKYRHDLAKHIRVMEYLQEAEAGLPALITAMKEQECAEKNIPFCYNVPAQLQLCMDEQDQTSLLVNILDNAIEANEKIEDPCRRWIEFLVEKEDEKNIIVLKNALELEEGQNFSLQTKKDDKENHGYGTRIIEEIVRKQQGTLVYKVLEEDKMLEVAIELPCEKRLD